ncbi:MAG: DUF721 domain-containing protein [Bacteroidales bacterium]|nr:DUF721 domain-containing protein [Bacteroidales bacterium]
MPRKNAITAGEAIMEFLKSAKLASGLDCRCIFKAWDSASGASEYTLKRFYRNGKLYITLSSSVIRSQLNSRKDLLLDRINSILKDDELFSKENYDSVKELILK